MGGYDRSPRPGHRPEKRHRWNRKNHTKSESVCVDCGLHRRALPVTEDSGMTQYFIAGKWLKVRAPTCPGRMGVHTSPHPPKASIVLATGDLNTIQQWLDKVPGRKMDGDSEGIKLTLASGFSRAFASLSEIAEFLRSKKEE
jgi:hypothetical protein